MLTFRVGAAGDTTRAGRMADHLMTPTLPSSQAELAARYLHGMTTPGLRNTAPEPRRDMDPMVARRLGIDPNSPLTRDQVAHLLAGKRADGRPVEGRSPQGPTENKNRNGYIDLCFSADKSVSLAWAFAPTEAERNIIMQAHRDAVDSAMRYVEKELGHARRGKAGTGGTDRGSMGWIKFDHYTSRPTLKIVRDEHGGRKLALGADNEARSGKDEKIDLKIAGDPNLHTHCAVPNLVLTENGRVGAIDLQRLQGRIHEFGAVYQAFLATNLRRSGIEVALDEKNGSARLTAIPERVRDHFSKMTREAHEVARAYAVELGADWDTMSEPARIKLLKDGANASRRTREDDVADREAWARQAAALNWTHASTIRDVSRVRKPTREERLDKAHERALPFLEDQFSRRSVLPASEARVAAARGLIAAGIDTDEDVGAVTALMRERGIRQDGRRTGLVWGRHGDIKGQERWYITTGLHIAQERELIRLTREAAMDHTLALTPAEIDAAAVQSGLDFTTGHGLNQRWLMERIGTGGNAAVGIGAAGSGKTAVLRPLVDAWRTRGFNVFGAALAWRQSDALRDAGIADQDTMALAAFLHRVNMGTVKPDASTVVVVDELGQIGTRQLLDMMRLRERYGFKLVAIGDDRQCQSIEAGPVIELMRKALGRGQVPELLTTIRQELERDREITLLFRDGRADEALRMKHEDGTVVVEPGGRRDAVRRVADLWDQRRRANHGDPSFKISVSAPTNADARDISAALREKRRAAGEIGEDKIVLAAQDQHGTAYELPLAVGDRVRLFDRVNASFGTSGGVIGNNGSVLEVLALDTETVTLRAATGIAGRVKWNTLRDRNTGRVRLTYGDAGTIDSQQGITSTEHIDALPDGTRTVQGFKAYVAESRHRRKAWLVTSEGAERQEVIDRRPAGCSGIVRDQEIRENMARNLSRQPAKQAAVDFVGMASDLCRSAIRAAQAGLQRREQRAADGRTPTTLGRTIFQRREAAAAPELAGTLGRATSGLERQAQKLDAFEHRLAGFGRVIAEVPDYAGEMAPGHLLEAMGVTTEAELPDAPEWAGQGLVREWAPAQAQVNRKPVRAGEPKRRLEPIPKEHLEALKDTVRLSDLIGQSVRLERAGHDFKGCCPFHEERTPSFHVNDGKGFYHCFGCGEHGDAVDWLGARHGMKFHEAVRYLENRSGITLPEAVNLAGPAVRKGPEWTPVFPVPAGAPPLIGSDGRTARIFNPKRAGTPKERATYRPKHVASYQDVNGNRIGYVIRVEIRDRDAAKDRKFTPQVTWVIPSDAPEGADPAKVGRWALWPMGDGRPLYHAEKLARNPDAPVIVVAGEKKADALQAVMGEAAVVVSWAGGDHGRHHVDYTPLADRDVTVWPDADLSGIKAALGEEDRKGVIRAGACTLIERAGAASVSVVIPPEGLPKGWDCGDLVKEGGGLEAVRDFLDRHTEAYQPARHRPVEKALEQPVRPRGADEQDIPLSL